jgi:hypothetical protein
MNIIQIYFYYKKKKLNVNFFRFFVIFTGVTQTVTDVETEEIGTEPTTTMGENTEGPTEEIKTMESRTEYSNPKMFQKFLESNSTLRLEDEDGNPY